MDSLNLDHHALSQSGHEQNKLIFLGSSGVAGSNVPLFSTVSDFFNIHQKKYESYNLATLQGTMPEVLVYFKQSLNYSPSAVVLGLSPDTLPKFSVSPVSAINLSFIQEDLDPELTTFIKEESRKKLYLNELTEKFWPHYPPPFQLIKLKSALYELRESLYGPLSNKNFTGALQHKLTMPDANHLQIKIVLQIAKTCQKNGIPFFIYFEPMFGAEKVYGQNLKKYQDRLKEILTQHQVVSFDYTNLIQEKSLFSDYIHLKPKGYERLAIKLSQDLEGNMP